MGKVIGICNQKGGVGKTTTAISMGVGLAEKGYKALLVDVDDSGNPSLSNHLDAVEEDQLTLTDLMMDRIAIAAHMSKREPIAAVDAIQHHKEGVDFIAADSFLPGITAKSFNLLDVEDQPFILNCILREIRSSYDFILLDAAPALNLMSTNVLTAADEVVLVTQPQGSAEEGVADLIKTCVQIKNSTNEELIIRGLLITMLDVRTNYNKKLSNRMTDMYTDLGMRVFQTRVPRGVSAEECVEEKSSVLNYDSKGKVATAYREFVEEYLQMIKEDE